MKPRMSYWCLVGLLQLFLGKVQAKYVEGRLKTLEDWAFVSRFCFLSNYGRYEYYLEYEKKLGDLKLLLYYDEVDQWHSVYKTGKTCNEKLSVLSINDNQIVELSPFNGRSGCTLRTSRTPTSQMETTTTSKPTSRVTNEYDSSYFDQFLKTTTQINPYSSTESMNSIENFGNESAEIDHEVSIFNETGGPELIYKHFNTDEEIYDNQLENSTAYKNDVEEIFEIERNVSRIRRAVPRIYENDKKVSILVTCHNAGGFTSSRPRWWYIAISNCGSNKGINVRYKFRMTNGELGDFWHEHFSADEMYIPPILLTEILAYTLLLLAIFLCAIELKSRHLYHCTYRLFTISAMLQWIGILLNSVTWAKYAVSGIGPFTILGGIFTGGSEITFLLLLLLMAKGYTITRARLSTPSTVKITLFINFYLIFHVSLYIYQAEAFDPGDVLNLYESTAGYMLAVLRLVAWGVFLISCSTTIRKFPEKRYFYYPFGVLGSVWIIAGPFLIFLVVGILDNWVRESVVFGSFALVAFVGHSAFLWLTWPSRANKSFPYHVRTNHIGIIASQDDDGADYPRHTYEPRIPDQSVIIPLSRRTEEMINNNIYMRDAYYNNGNAPISHISLPQQCLPTAPAHMHNRLPSPPPSNLYPDTLNNNDEEEAENIGKRILGSAKRDLKSAGAQSSQTSGENGMDGNLTSRHSSLDSGHSSLENSTSPHSNEPPTTPQETPHNSMATTDIPDDFKATLKSIEIPSPQPKGILKENPFKVTSSKPANKIILEPIQHPIQNNLSVINGTSVPRHLFAAVKKPSQ